MEEQFKYRFFFSLQNKLDPFFQFNLEHVFPETLVFLPKRNSKVGFPCGQKKSFF